jgi:diguanylate cyclase (GGDEF)-like protein
MIGFERTRQPLTHTNRERNTKHTVPATKIDTRVNLATHPASVQTWRTVSLVITVMLLVGLSAILFGRQPVGNIPAFLPTLVSAIIVTELLSAYVFLGQFPATPLPRLLFLGTAYLLSGSLAIPYLLTFPKVYSPSGLFGANEQTAVYLWLSWHAGFPALIAISAYFHDRRRYFKFFASHANWAICAAFTACGAAAVFLPYVLIRFQQFVPVLVTDGTFSATAKQIVIPTICFLDALAVGCLLRHRKPYSATTAWLFVALTASALDTAMGLSFARYSYVWYVGKMFSMVSSSVVLALYIREMVNLQVLLRGATQKLRNINAVIRRKAQERLEYLAYHDEMTGLPNRARWQELLRDRIQSGRDGGEEAGFSILFIDLDSFKEVNDAVGHGQGDEVLIAVGKRLSDVAFTDNLVGRVGGDEFAVLVPSLRRTGDAEKLADLVLEAMRKAFLTPSRDFELSASVGIAHYPENGNNAAELLQHADLALFHAKRSGGDCKRRFESWMSAECDRARALKDALAQGSRCGDFVLHYQPIFDLRSGRIDGVEALIRWMHPTEGIVLPAAFIPLAEETGLMPSIGKWVVENAIAQAREWNDAGQSLKISVNISVRQLQDPTFLYHLRRTLKKCSVSPRQIELEVTESAAMTDPAGVSELLGRCRELGLLIALDDFGTHYSSLTYLRQLPIDTIKVDQSFVKELPFSEEDGQIVRALISLGHGLGRSIVAEGVETREQFNWLNKASCDLVQGYFIAKPMRAEHLLAWRESRLPLRASA